MIQKFKSNIIDLFLKHINSTNRTNIYIDSLCNMLDIEPFTKHHYHSSLRSRVINSDLKHKLTCSQGSYIIDSTFTKIDTKDHSTVNLVLVDGEIIIDYLIKDNIIMVDSTLEEKGVDHLYSDELQNNSIVKIGNKTFMVESLPPNDSAMNLLKKVDGSLIDQTNSKESNYFGYPYGDDYVLTKQPFINGYTFIDKNGDVNLFKKGINLKLLDENQEEIYGQYKRIGIADNSIEYIKSKYYYIDSFIVFDINMNHANTIGNGDKQMFLLEINENNFEPLV